MSRPCCSKRHLVVVAAFAGGLWACSLSQGGFADRFAGDGAAFDVLPLTDGAGRPLSDARPPGVAADAGVDDAAARVPMFVAGEPAFVGCADGSREGFLDPSLRGWPSIAGCGGGWSVPGLMSSVSRTVRCDRRSGNTSPNPSGIGCGPADLCAVGWHVCAGAGEVQRLSPSHCESIVAPGVRAFFAIAGGGNGTGDCVVDVALSNDVRGCGTLGQPEGDGCYPLDRRLEFGDCLQTQGVWNCGLAADHLIEVERVFKTQPELGGVLCCRDER